MEEWTPLKFDKDLVKTRLQSQQAKSNGEQLYTSMWDCFKKTYKCEGFRGLYRGSGVNILLIAPEKAIRLTANDYCRFHFSEEKKLPLMKQMLSGAIETTCQTIITTPMELLKVQMQNAGMLAALGNVEEKATPEISATHIAKTVLRQEGIKGLYRGASITVMRDVFFTVTYIPFYVHLSYLGPKRCCDKKCCEHKKKTAHWYTFLAGFSSSLIATIFSTPFDIMKTRLQFFDGVMKYSGIADAASQILTSEGPMALLKGGATRLLAIAPAFGILQAVYYFGLGEHVVGMEH